MADANARFAGSIPQTYHDHLGPLYFEPHAADLASRLNVPPGGRILELAAGTGILTRHLRDRFGERATIVATDLNDGMLDVGRRRHGATPGLEWRQADAMALPFPAESFDAVICQFGLMFFPDKPAAVRDVFRVLRPGSRFLFSVWDSFARNPLARLAHETIAGFFPSSPPEFYLVPYGFHDTAAIRRLLRDAGFAGIDIASVHLEATAPTAEHAAIGLVRGNPVLLAIEERGSAKPDVIIAALARVLASALGDRPLRAPMSAYACSAIR